MALIKSQQEIYVVCGGNTMGKLHGGVITFFND
jgi:hypothetical protein